MFKREINITRIKKQRKEELQDIVLIESPVNIYINSEPLVNIICLNKDLEELAIGFLFSVGIINAVKDVKKFEKPELDNNIYITLQNSINLLLLQYS